MRESMWKIYAIEIVLLVFYKQEQGLLPGNISKAHIEYLPALNIWHRENIIIN